MKVIKILAVVLAIASFALISCLKRESVEKETVLDGKVFLEKELITDIPQISRLCDELNLTKHRIDVGGGEIYCEENGKGTPIVLLHGGPGATHHYFHPHFSLASHFARVIYYDQRGCGISDHARGDGYSMDTAVEDMERIRKALEIEKWIVLGHSYGGFLAQYYATKYPENLAGLVLVGSSLGMHADLKPTRQYDYIAKEERARMKEIREQVAEYQKQNEISDEKAMEILVFNNHLNGDWKRQNFYKPSFESLARGARYEWKHDPYFRGDMSRSMSKIDLKGAFDGCPIPTMIMEGRWDLTWNTDKPGILLGNHPGAELVMFERSSHNPFEDEPEEFFGILRNFISDLPEVSWSDIKGWKDYLVKWKSDLESQPMHILRMADHSPSSYQRIARIYSEDWLNQIEDARILLTAGYALYEAKRYEEALRVFRKGEELSQENANWLPIPLIWQGHMLDLLGRREESVKIYRKVVDLNDHSEWTQSQYGLRFKPSPYAEMRIQKPFERVENQLKD